MNKTIDFKLLNTLLLNINLKYYNQEALINEIELMRALNHPNIIRLHEVFETDNSLYMVLDLLEGGQLYDKIKAKYRYATFFSDYKFL